MADESVVALLARENKNAVMLLNERRRALKWEERQVANGFEVLVTLDGKTFRGQAQNKKAAKAAAAKEALINNPHLLSTPETLTLDNGRSPVAELNELTNALAKWTISERNDDGMIKAEVAAWSNSFVGLGHNKRMAKNIAAKEALKNMPHNDAKLKSKKNSRRLVNHQQVSEKQPLCEVNEKLPKQVKYIIRPIHTSLITAIAQFNGNEYEGSGFTQREAKNEAARSLLKANSHLQQTTVTLEDGRNPLAVLHERLPDVTIDTIESSPGMFKVNAVYRNQRFEGVGFNLNLAKRRAAKKLLLEHPVFLEEAQHTKNGLLPIAELAQKVLLKFTTVKSEPGHCIVRCELDARNIFTGESWCVKIARQKCAMNVLENYPLLKMEMPKLDDGKSPLLVLNSKRPALTYELEQKHDAKWIARVTIGQEQFSGEGYKKNIAKGYAALAIIQKFGIENLEEEKEIVQCKDGSHPTTRINEKFPGLVSYQELGESSSSGVKTYTIQIQIRSTGGGQKFKGTGRNKKLARAKASLSALQHLFPGEY